MVFAVVLMTGSSKGGDGSFFAPYVHSTTDDGSGSGGDDDVSVDVR